MTARIVPGDGDPRHGTINGYTNLRCRCADCLAAHRVYLLPFQRAWRANRNARGLTVRGGAVKQPASQAAALARSRGVA